MDHGKPIIKLNERKNALSIVYSVHSIANQIEGIE